MHLRHCFRRTVFYYGFLLALAFVSSASFGSTEWRMGGPEGGPVNHFVLQPGNPNTMYAATSGGVFKTTDAGQNWAYSSSGLTTGHIFALAIHPSSPNTLFAAAGAIYKSTDAGASWNRVGVSQILSNIYSLAVDPQQPNTVYSAALEQRFLKSTDGGSNWSESAVGLPASGTMCVAVDPHNPGTLYAGTAGNGVYKSTDRGTTWVPANSGMETSSLHGLAVHPATSSLIYATTRDGVFRSTNNGAAWIAMNTGLGYQTSTYGPGLDPANPSNLFVGTDGGGVFRTTDGGQNWVAANNGLTNSYVYTAPVVHPGNAAIVYVGTFGGGFFKSDNAGVSWTPSNSGLYNVEVHSLAAHPAKPGTVFVGTYGSGLFRSTDGGATFPYSHRTVCSGFVMSVTVDPQNPSLVYAGGVGIAKSTDGGATWSPLSADTVGYNVRSVAVDPTNSSVLYAAGYANGLLKSTDGGAGWQSLIQGLNDAWVVAIDPKNAQNVYLGTYSGALYRSTNAGIGWTSATTGLPSGQVLDIAVHRQQNGVVLAAVGYQGIFRSTDGGVNWAPANTGLTTHGVTEIISHPTDPSSFYAGTSNGSVFFSSDGGQTWSPVISKPPTMTNSGALAVDPLSPGIVYFGTLGAGVFTRAIGPESSYYFPQIADGLAGGQSVRTSLIFVNTGQDSAVRVEFFNQAAKRMSLPVGEAEPAYTLFFSLKAGASVSLATPGTGTLRFGHARVETSPGVGGTAVFSSSENGVVLYETGVPATTGQREFSLFVDYAATRNTGVAMVNTGTAGANATFRLYDKQFNLRYTKPISALLAGFGPGAQFSRYASEIFPELASLTAFEGTMTVESDQPLAAITVRQRDEPGLAFSTCTFPVVPGRADAPSPGTGSAVVYYFPQLADGRDGAIQFHSTIILANAGDATTAKIDFLTSGGISLQLPFEGLGSRAHIEVALKRGEALVLKTTGVAGLQSGYARVTTTDRVGGTAVFAFYDSGQLMYEAGVPASFPLSNFAVFMDATENLYDTGVAIVNTGSVNANTTFMLYDKDHVLRETRSASQVLSASFGPQSHLARFAAEIFSKISTENIRIGTVEVRSDQPLASVTLRQRDNPAIPFPGDIYLMTAFPVVPIP